MRSRNWKFVTDFLFFRNSSFWSISIFIWSVESEIVIETVACKLRIVFRNLKSRVIRDSMHIKIFLSFVSNMKTTLGRLVLQSHFALSIYFYFILVLFASGPSNFGFLLVVLWQITNRFRCTKHRPNTYMRRVSQWINAGKLVRGLVRWICGSRKYATSMQNPNFYSFFDSL